MGPELLVVDEEEEDPVVVANGTRFVTDAVPDCDMTEVEIPDELAELAVVVAATPADVEEVEAAPAVDKAAADSLALVLLLLLLLPDEATNGFDELPPVPWVRSTLKLPIELC